MGRHLTSSLACRSARPCHFFNTPQVRPPVGFVMSCLWYGITASQACHDHAVDMQGCKKGDACPFEHVPAEGASLGSRQIEFNSRQPQRYSALVQRCPCACPCLLLCELPIVATSVTKSIEHGCRGPPGRWSHQE